MKHTCVLCWLAVFLLPSAPANGENEEAGIKAVFIDLERIARLPDEELKKEVLRVYNNIYGTTQAHLLLPGTHLPVEKPEALTPEQLADELQRALGNPWLYAAADARCKEILQKHQDILRPTVENALKGEDRKTILKALSFICDFRPDGLFDAVVRLFNESDDLANEAASTLSCIDDPRAIPIIVNRDRNRPTFTLTYFESLRRLQRNRIPDKNLLELLSSDNETVRWHAAYALAESRDVTLITHVKRLVGDPSPEVRRAAANMGFLLNEPGYSEVRPHLVKLLRDSNKTVRLFVAVVFAQRKDKVCASILLELIKDDSIEESYHSNVYQAINNLTGSYFGYYHGSDGWKPSTPANRAAIDRFEKWVRDNAERSEQE